MKLKILSWNVRGANDKDKREVIKAFLSSQRVELVCLQETKIQNLDDELVHCLGASRSSQWGALDVIGVAREVSFFFRITKFLS